MLRQWQAKVLAVEKDGDVLACIARGPGDDVKARSHSRLPSDSVLICERTRA